MSQESVSIVVPCYNVSDRLPRCLDSLVNQTLFPVEIICVNDGSQDDTLCVLNQYASRYPNIFIIDKDHEGTSKAREVGIRVSTGRFCGFCDADDCVEPETYETLYRRAVDDDADMVVCAYERIVDHKIVSTEMCHFSNRCIQVTPDSGWFALVNTGLCNKLFKRSVLEQRLSLENPPRIMEDAMMLLSILPYMKKISFTDRPLYHYFTSKGSAMSYLTKDDVPVLIDCWKDMKEHVLAVDGNLADIVDLMAFVHLGVSASLRMLGMPRSSMRTCFELASHVLKTDFPLYEESRFLQKAYLDQYQDMKKIAFAHRFYRAKMMLPALRLYRFVTDFLSFDIKW